MLKYTFRRARREGRKDGRSWMWGFPLIVKKEPHPAVDQIELPASLEMAKSAYEQMILRWVARWKNDERKISKHTAAIREKRDLVEETMRNEKQLNPGLPPAISYYIYLPAMAIIGMSEFVLNAEAFQIFGQSMIKTYLIAGSLVIAMPFSAHILGKSLRAKVKNWLAVWIISLIMCFSFIALSLVRARFFEAAQIGQLLGISMPVWMLSSVLLIINVLLFAVAAFLAYEAHCENWEARKVWQALNSTKGRLVYLEKKLNLKADTRLAQAQRLNLKFREYCGEYHQCNRKARGAHGAQLPQWAKHIPELKISESWFEPLRDSARLPADINQQLAQSGVEDEVH